MAHSSVHIDAETIARVLPAFFGSIVAVIRSKKRPPLGEAVMQVFTGFVTAYYLTPVVGDLLRVNEQQEHWQHALGFTVGLIGYSILPTLTRISREIFKTTVERIADDESESSK